MAFFFPLLILFLPLNMQQTTRIHAYIFQKRKRATNAQKKSWKERESTCKCSNYSSSNEPVMDIPISFNAAMLSQLISPAWILIFELNPSRATYKNWRLTRGSRVVTGKVGRVVSMNLRIHTQKKKNHRHQMGEKRRWSYFAMRLVLGSSFISFFLFSKKMNGRPPALLSIPFALLKDNELPVPMAFASSMQSTHETHN